MEQAPAPGKKSVGLFVLFLAGFWVAQAIVVVLFKCGSDAPGLWVLFFVAGNAIGVGSAALWMAALKRGSGNIATGLAVGGAFLLQQIALVLVFRGNLTLVQVAGIAAIVGGMLCLAFGARAKQPGHRARREAEAEGL